jgi:hypothetical protein
METPEGIITPNEIVRRVPGGKQRDENDHRALRWNRDQHEGYMGSKMFQSTPMFFSAEGHNLWMGDMYKGRSAFLISSGPSFTLTCPDPQVLAQPGILTMGLNNSPKMFRPNMWTCVDSPANFMRSIWLDPTIQKFVPFDHVDKPLLDNDSGPANNFEHWDWLPTTVRDCPNVHYFRRNEHFRASQYLWEDTFNWGNHKDLGGGRSVFLVAIKLLYLLGVRRVFLLGVDLDMSPEKKYSFDQDRSPGSIRGNNQTYQMLQERFTALRPLFEKEGFNVYNCNPNSKLTAFDHVPFADALEQVQLEFGLGRKIDTVNENTKGLYDREDKEKKKREAEAREAVAKAGAPAEPEIQALVAPTAFPPEERADAKARLDASRAILEEAKTELKQHEDAKPIMTDPGFEAWEIKLIELRQKTETARLLFRTREDEKRYKHGEPTRWGLWLPEDDK